MRQRKTMAVRLFRRNAGFTLVEMMLTLAVSTVILAALYTAYLTQQRSQSVQEQVAEVQQNIRAGLGMMTSEIRMAGFDPKDTANAGILVATPGRFQFTKDLNENGSLPPTAGNPNENITYGFSDGNDAGKDGVADAGVAPLGRDTGGGFQSIAENIQAVEFVYLLGDTLKPTLAPAAAELEKIRAVTVSVLARVGNADPKYTNTMAYEPASKSLHSLPTANWGPYDDNFRRRLYVTTVQLRNMGL